MKTTLYILHSRVLGVIAALFVPFLAAATGPIGPSGNYTNNVTDPTNAVWDFGGVINNANIDVSNKNGDSVQAAIPANFTQSGSGKVSGLGTNVPVDFDVNSVSDSMTATVTEKGSINSTKGGSHLVFTITASGTATLPGKTHASHITLSQQINATINNTNQTIIGTRKGTAAASGVGAIVETSSISNTVSSVSSGGLKDGSWTLILDSLSTSNNQVTGTAEINLNSGQSFGYSVKGAFNSTKGTKLLLTGSDAISKGSAIQVTIDTNNVVTNIKGRITGQNVNASF